MQSSGIEDYRIVSKKLSIDFRKRFQESRQHASDERQQQTTEEDEHNLSEKSWSGGINEGPAYDIDPHNIPRDNNKVSDESQLPRHSPNKFHINGLSSPDREVSCQHSETDNGSEEDRQYNNGDYQQLPTLDADEPDIFECSKVFVQDDQSQTGIVDDEHVKLGDTNTGNSPAKNDFSVDFQLNHKCPATFIVCKQRFSNDHVGSVNSFKPDYYICGRCFKRSPGKVLQCANDDCQELLESSQINDLNKSETFTQGDSLSGKIGEIDKENSGENNKSPDFGHHVATLNGKKIILNDHGESGSHFKINENSNTARFLLNHCKHCNLSIFAEKKVISNASPAVSFVSSKLQTHLPNNDGSNNSKIGCNTSNFNNFSLADSVVRTWKRSKNAWISNSFFNRRRFAQNDSCPNSVLSRKTNKSACVCTSGDRTTSKSLKEYLQAGPDIGDKAPHFSVSALVKYFENIARLGQKSRRETKSQKSLGRATVQRDDHSCSIKKDLCTKEAKSDVDSLYPKEDNSHFLLIHGPDESCTEMAPIVKNNSPSPLWLPLDESKVTEEERQSLIFKMQLARRRKHLERISPESEYFEQNVTTKTDSLKEVTKQFISDNGFKTGAWQLERSDSKSIFHTNSKILETSDNLSDLIDLSMHEDSDILTQKTVPENLDNFERNTSQTLLDTSDMLRDQRDLKVLNNTDTFPEQKGLKMFDNLPEHACHNQKMFGDLLNLPKQEDQKMFVDLVNLPKQEDRKMFGHLVNFPELEGVKMSGDLEKNSEQEDQHMFDVLDHFQEQTVSEIIDNSKFFQAETGDFHPKGKSSWTIGNELREIPVEPSASEAVEDTAHLKTRVKDFGMVSKLPKPVPAIQESEKYSAELSDVILRTNKNSQLQQRIGEGCVRKMFLGAVVSVFAVFVAWSLLLKIH